MEPRLLGDVLFELVASACSPSVEPEMTESDMVLELNVVVSPGLNSWGNQMEKVRQQNEGYKVGNGLFPEQAVVARDGLRMEEQPRKSKIE